MQEFIDKFLDHVIGAWRFRRYALISAWVVAITGWTYVFVLPDVYQAHSRIFVDTKTALKPVLEGLTLDQDVNVQLNLVRQSLLAGPQLEPVAQEVGLLDLRTATAQERARVVKDIRDAIGVTVTRAAGQQDGADREAGSIYAISYSDVSRERSLKVVEILQNRLIENTLGGKRSGSENAQRFLQDQIAEIEQRLRLAEGRLAEFKKRNVGLMPAEQGGYFARLQSEMDAVSTAQSSLAIAVSRRNELQRQLRGEAPLAAATGMSSVSGTHGANGGDTLSRINETQARLDDLLLRFTDKHPDVTAARENLRQLRQRREQELAALRRGDPNAAAASGASANPVYQSIQLALNQAEVEVATLRRSIEDHNGKVAELRKMLDTMPQVEAEFARLNRDYDVTRANYTELVARLEKSRLGEQATSSGSVRFDIIEPPNAPFKPVSPSRSILILGILVAALVAGAGVALLMHQLKPVYNTARALAQSTGLQVLGYISMGSLDKYQEERRKAFIRYSAFVAALVLVTAVVLQLSRMGLRLA
jgi:polysaccharide chain length determinant protein (PEP-CTERM system associated)